MSLADGIHCSVQLPLLNFPTGTVNRVQVPLMLSVVCVGCGKSQQISYEGHYNEWLNCVLWLILLFKYCWLLHSTQIWPVNWSLLRGRSVKVSLLHVKVGDLGWEPRARTANGWQFFTFQFDHGDAQMQWHWYENEKYLCSTFSI